MNKSVRDNISETIKERLLKIEPVKNNLKLIEIIKGHIESEEFLDKINLILIEKDYSCKAALKLCGDIIDELAGDDSPKNWLEYIYYFALRKSFPEAVTIKLIGKLELPCIIYLEFLKVISEFEKKYGENTWLSKYPLDFLTEEEEAELEDPREYKTFKNAFEKEYIYEMMKLNQELMGYSTLHHICGVHHLALYVARQLKKLGHPIDLGRVSGSAAGHDIGKFGCKPLEAKRVAYLHYYYTDEWFKKHDINYIRNIAINHSTWDLELENLPLESLILIYADFRVKRKDKKDGSSDMHIYSLDESFEVILNKLDNVDEAKEKRYMKVYAKLKDFEDYMVDLGVNVDLDKDNYHDGTTKKYYPLMHGNEIINNIKYFAINHNIHLMYKLRDETSLNEILEQARSERRLNNIREYLNVLEEYSTYLTQKQKLITLNFLYEQLIHPEDDIRKKCSELIGSIIAIYDEVYRKEVPQDVEIEIPELTGPILFQKYLNLFINPSEKVIKLHQMWIVNSLDTMIEALFRKCRINQRIEYINLLLQYYKIINYDEDVCKNLLYCIKYIDIKECNEEALDIIFNFILNMIDDKDVNIRLEALEVTNEIIPKLETKSKYINILKDKIYKLHDYSSLPAENYIKFKVSKLLKMEDYIIERFYFYCKEDNVKMSNIFLSNLKTDTGWVLKKVHVDLLVEHTLTNPEYMGIHTAMHFCNLLKVSSSEDVRNRAGKALIDVFQFLSYYERNDISIELLRSLEIEGYQFTKYIPKYLGQLILYLQPGELDELLDDLIEKIKQSNSRVITLLLETVGIAIEHYPKYRDRVNEIDKKYKDRLIRMLGIILNGLVHDNISVKQMALNVIGRNIFGSNILTLEKKEEIFELIGKKILTLIEDFKDNRELLFLTNAAVLNHIYRFVSNYRFCKGSIELKSNKKIAFFPGSFDPFSLSHKEIAKEIRDQGFEVYLAVDEFSWSKRTQPNLIRREIIKMSIADELDIYLFPKELQTNIANPEDLKKLKSYFKGNEVYIVVGSDVVLNASAYKDSKNVHYICSFNHIIFERKSLHTSEYDNNKLTKVIKRIKGKTIKLSLPTRYEDISSTQIRNYIDEDRDISRLVDPLVQKYIYDNGLYRREPQYKTLVQTKSINIEIISQLHPRFLHELSSIFKLNHQKVYNALEKFGKNLNPRILVIRDITNNGRILGFSAFHWIRSSMFYKEFGDSSVSEYVRKNYIGRIIVIDGVYLNKDVDFEGLEDTILTETLTYCLAKDYTYGIFRNIIEGYQWDSMIEVLKLQGFEEIPSNNKASKFFAVNMTAPCTLNLDVETIIKEPFNNNTNVKKAISRTRKRLKEAIVNLYPGNLLLSFDRNIMYENLIKKICDNNNVSIEPSQPRQLGEAICVPFGDLLNGCIIPNTITKSLHTEKIFSKNIKNYRIGSYPNYLSLPNQVRMIKSFNKPVILVDDLLHKGYRIKALDPLLKKEGINVKKIIVGILSGRGKELMDLQKRDVDSAYFVPNLRVWFSESFMYPFIEGHVLWRESYTQRNLVPSINLILPYTSPSFIKGTTNEAIYNLSKVCFENAIDILTVLENEYLRLNERNLTLAHLGDILLSPKSPDHGENLSYDFNIGPVQYLKNDLQRLERLKHSICNE